MRLTLLVLLKVPAADIEKLLLLASHREFAKSTHTVQGDKDVRLNSYTVLKGPEMKIQWTFAGHNRRDVLHSNRALRNAKWTKKDLEAGSKWKDIGAMQEMMGKNTPSVITSWFRSLQNESINSIQKFIGM